jgi:uncharacterized protein YndB with AHSA1/START domain
MSKGFTEIHVQINAPASVWEALVNPELIKQYLFDTEVTTDWNVGGPITCKEYGKASHLKIKVRF